MKKIKLLLTSFAIMAILLVGLSASAEGGKDKGKGKEPVKKEVAKKAPVKETTKKTFADLYYFVSGDWTTVMPSGFNCGTPGNFRCSFDKSGAVAGYQSPAQAIAIVDAKFSTTADGAHVFDGATDTGIILHKRSVF